MSWTSPHTASGGQPAPGPYVGPPYAGQPVPPRWPPAQPRKTRTGLIVLLIALPLALVIAVSAALISTLDGDKQLSDAEGRVTVTVPRTWSDDTAEDAGERVEHGKQDEYNYTIPDLETGGFVGSLEVYVEDQAAARANAHTAAVNEQCELMGCISRGRPNRVEVGGRPGTEQVLEHPEDESTIVLTVESENLVVTLLGAALEEDRDAVVAIMRSVVVNR